MKFTKSPRALLFLGLFKEADTQDVTVTIGESGPHVFMEFSGTLTVLPSTTTFICDNYGSNFFSDGAGTYVTAAAGISCK